MNDFLNMGDSFCPKGLVIIQDATGKVLVKKHNMILREGKSVLLAKMVNGVFNSGEMNFTSPDADVYSGDANYIFDGIFLSDTAGETEYTREYNDEANNEKYYYTFSEDFKKTDGVGENTITLYYGNNPENPSPAKDTSENIYKQYCLKFKLTIKTDETKQTSAINSLGILLKNESNSYKMFSRVVFDTIPLQAGAKYVVSYYVYF